MPSPLRSKSYGSVKVFWLDREEVLRRALEACRRILAHRPEVLRAAVFGSVARGTAVPGSDLDVLLVLESPAPAPSQRSLPYQPYFEDVGLGTDIFCVTRGETAEHPIYRRNAADAIWVSRSR